MAKHKITNKTKLFLGVGIIAVGLFVGLWLLPYLGLYSLTPATPVTPATSYNLVFHDALDSTNDDEVDPTIAWYEEDVSDLEEDEIADLAFADFVSTGSGDDLTPEDGYIYIAKITQTDFVSQYWATDSRIFEGNLPLLALGDNDIYMYNETEDVAIACYSIGGVTVNQTDYDEWTIVTSCLDASEATTAEVTHKEGYRYFYNPETPAWNTPVIKLTFNDTATSAFCSLEDVYEYTEVCSTVYMYIAIEANINDVSEFHIDLGSGLGTDFELVTIGFGYGNADSCTVWDSQS
jgi:hypothetical protein